MGSRAGGNEKEPRQSVATGDGDEGDAMILTGLTIMIAGSFVPMLLWYLGQITWRLNAVVCSLALTVGGVLMGILDFWPFWLEVLFWTYIGVTNLGSMLWVGFRRPPQWGERGLRW